MDLKVLGGLAVHEGGVSISPPSAATRQVLALLVASADRVVPTCAMAEELWPEEVPENAGQILETHVRQLRATIGAALQTEGSVRTAEEVLAWVPGGYRLGTGGGSSDARVFERTAGAGYRAMETGDLDLASRRLREALDLWTAAPFAGVAQGPHLRSHAALLTGSWQRAVDRWIDVDFRLGRWRELCADLAQVLSRFPPPALPYVQLKADLDTKGHDPEVIRRHLHRRRNALSFTAHRIVMGRQGSRSTCGSDRALSLAAAHGIGALQRA
ncbi:BTAD domain-containing putative transcriptional regulator [Streptomyces sp. FH025]|uniref:AfsR/SARP family transcriptional regulator n=1 Tax=Streptomyces sp. FH025 TaxID=2815937 RepID=UPI001A9E8D55|nr:BTAD domain-containing putative transcriptional regulator [Streptomyces sp. FH025]MBO1413643.1 winged helix-turn-helix domain-containing protein [Streptomyces sp. FH025]